MQLHHLIARRLLLLVPVWFGISLFAFSIATLAPGDPAYNIYLQRTSRNPPSLAALEPIREEFDLEGSFFTRYAHWTASAVQGDFGKSYETGEPVVDKLGRKLGATTRLALGGLVVACLIAFPLGILSAVRHNRLSDMASRLVALLGASVPSFWLGYLFILLFSVKLGWLPVAGSGTWKHAILPTVTLGIGGAAILSRLVRSSMLDVLRLDFIRAARAKGVSEPRIILRDALRNALIPVVTVMGLIFGALMGGAVVVEVVFSWPGIGRLIVEAITFRDLAVIQGFVLFVGTIIVLVNLVVDVSYALIDPRIRVGLRGGRLGA